MELKIEIVRRGIRQQDVAKQLRITSATLSLYLNGHRQPPPDFRSRVLAALDRIERAERAADEARRRVLAS